LYNNGGLECFLGATKTENVMDGDEKDKKWITYKSNSTLYYLSSPERQNQLGISISIYCLSVHLYINHLSIIYKDREIKRDRNRGRGRKI
jgi:hypothetical protein